MLDHLSASQITTWLKCPLKYRLTYIDNVPWAFKPAALVFGTAIHAALEQFYRAWKQGERLPLSALLKAFDTSWREALEEDLSLDTDDPEGLIDQGHTLLAVFHDHVRPQTILAVEEPFDIPLVDPTTGQVLDITLRGRFDLIEADQNGIPVIVDHKTLARRPSDSDLQNNIQLLAYAYASRQIGLLPEDRPALMRIDALMKTKTPTMESRFWSLAPDRDTAFFQLAAEVARAINADIFPANPGWTCTGCPVAGACYW